MSPPFLFRIDELQEHPDAISHYDNQGHWVPCTDPGANRRVGGGASGKYYYCDTQQIYEVPSLPDRSTLYKTYSVYFVGGQGFRVLRGDATRPAADENWHPLRFEHSTDDYSSFLNNAAGDLTLAVRRRDQLWPRMLLPDIYHGDRITRNQSYGGLIGELPILLALIAFSTSRDTLPNVLPAVFRGGAWKTHQILAPRTPQRGVVVYVWTCPPSYAGGSTEDDLEEYEQGSFGKYFN